MYRILTGQADELNELFCRIKMESKKIEGLFVDIDSITNEAQRLIDGKESDIIVIEDKGKIIGGLGMLTFNEPCSGKLVAQEHLWFVLKRHRGIGSLRLINAARIWAKKQGCTHLMFSANELVSNLHDRTCLLYEKLGMKKIETSYIERL